MRLPILLYLIIISILLTLIFLISSYIAITSLSETAIKNNIDNILLQSAKTAQNVFDKKITSSYIAMLSLASHPSLLEATRNNDEEKIAEALLSIYDQQPIESIYNIFFYRNDNGLIIDQSYSPLVSNEDFITNIIKQAPLSKEVPNAQMIDYHGTALVIMSARVASDRGTLYAGLKVNGYNSLVVSILQQTASQCVSFHQGAKTLLLEGEGNFCQPYFNKFTHADYILREVSNNWGAIKHPLSNQTNFSNISLGLVIPLNDIARLESSLRQTIYQVLLYTTLISIILLTLAYKIIANAVKKLTNYAITTLQNKASLVPTTPIKEFEVIADAFDTIVHKLKNEISSRQQVEHDLSNTNQLLTTALAEVQAANEAKSSFLANISHEIRTPINSIINLSRILSFSIVEKEHSRYIKNIYQSSQSLLRLINDLLDFSKINAGRLELEEHEFYLSEIVDDIRNTISSKAEDKKINFILDIDWHIRYTLMGDTLRLKQVLLNLCENAIKFTEQGSVQLTIKLTQQDEKRLWFTFIVADTGIGIALQDQVRIFEVFSQVDNSVSRRFGGTGLGLSIVKHLVQLMGGTIQLESALGKGSHFICKLPFNYTIAPKPYFNNLAILRNQFIAILADEKNNSEIIAAMLHTLGISYSIHNNIETLKAFFATGGHCNVLIIDYLPSHSTHQNLIPINHWLQLENPKPKTILFIPNHYYLQSDDALVINKTLKKPVTLSDLYDTLMNVLGHTTPQNLQLLPAISPNWHQLFTNKSILVAEDNEINQEITQILLEHVGIKVVLASNGVETLEWVKKEPFDLVLMDVQMPIMDGFEATKRLRQQWDAKKLPIIGLTAHAMERDRQACLEVGMNDYLTKPIDPQLLYQALQRQFAQAALIPISAPPEPKPEPSIEGIPLLPGIDVQDGLARIHQLIPSYKRILAGFRKTHLNDVAQFNDALAAQDLTKIHYLTHKLCGSAANIGAKQLASLCLELEHSKCQEEDIETLNPLILKIVAELQLVLVGLEQLGT